MSEAPSIETESDVQARITAYLAGGGLFNPELADHSAVRDLLLDARSEINRLARLGTVAAEMAEALKLHVAYEAMPTDRGGWKGPKGTARGKWIDARDAALLKYQETADGR